jgi:hypothetical protein
MDFTWQLTAVRRCRRPVNGADYITSEFFCRVDRSASLFPLYRMKRRHAKKNFGTDDELPAGFSPVVVKRKNTACVDGGLGSTLPGVRDWRRLQYIRRRSRTGRQPDKRDGFVH